MATHRAASQARAGPYSGHVTNRWVRVAEKGGWRSSCLGWLQAGAEQVAPAGWPLEAR